MVRIVVLGKPGAGKSTHAKILAKKLKIKYIEAGDLLRKEAKKGTKIGKLIKEKIDKGEYAPDWITNKLVLKEAKKAKKGFVLSGYPRDEEQAEFFVKNFKVDLILDIDVDDEVIVKRLSSRRVCPKCGRIYNLLFEKPKKDMLCDVCKVKLIRREDDRPRIIRKRLKIYYQVFPPVMKILRKNEFRIVKVKVRNVKESVEEIEERIERRIERFLGRRIFS